jgi:hypothetical protein
VRIVSFIAMTAACRYAVTEAQLTRIDGAEDVMMLLSAERSENLAFRAPGFGCDERQGSYQAGFAPDTASPVAQKV